MRLKTYAAILFTVFLISVAGVFWITSKGTQDLAKARQLWREYDTRYTGKVSEIIRIRNASGYGGFIQHYKDFILNGNVENYRKAKADIEIILSGINAYSSYQTSVSEKQALATLNDLFGKYKNRLDDVRQMYRSRSDVDPAELNKSYQLNDASGREALNALSIALAKVHQSSYAQLAGVIGNTSKSLSVYIPLGLILIMIITVCALILANLRVLRQTNALMKTVDILREENMDAEIPFLNSKGEIGDIARAVARFRNQVQNVDQLKSEFVATMSHEIRSPMTGVIGMAELLLSTNQTEVQRNYTQTIINSGEALLDIIEDILDFSKIEADQVTIDPVPVNVVDLVDDITALYSPRAREKAIEVAVRYVPGTEQFVYIDPVRVRQILSNLINNAIKFTEKGYIAVTVRNDNSFLPDEKDNNAVGLKFTVKDTGIGITDAAQHKIFDKFSQADASTTRLYGGTGLGLSICKKLAELMGGSVSVQSTPGEGSEFSVNIVAHKNTEEYYEPLRPKVLHDLRVLVVDDLAIIRKFLGEQMTIAGMRCDVVDNGHDALEMMRAAVEVGDPYKIVTIDYLMPHMNGEALARAISDDKDMAQSCLVMLTGAGQIAVSGDYERKGFSAYISKPVRARHFIETIAQVWSRYKAGATDVLLQIDSQDMTPQHGEEDKLLAESKVLLAEDSRINQAYAVDVLEKMGCEVHIAVNGAEALDALNQYKFDLVLMDCQMPEMDGFEASRRIKSLKAEGKLPMDLPVVALTANAMKGDRERCFEAGMSDYLAKPVRREDLRETAFKWITGRSLTRSVDERVAAGKDGIISGQSLNSEASTSNVSPPLSIDNDENSTILDLSTVAETKSFFKDTYSEMVDIFIEDVETYMREIQESIQTEDFENAIRPAHTIKSSSMRMGAVKLSGLAKDMELTLRQEDIPVSANDIKSKVSVLEDVFLKTREALKETIQAA